MSQTQIIATIAEQAAKAIQASIDAYAPGFRFALHILPPDGVPAGFAAFAGNMQPGEMRDVVRQVLDQMEEVERKGDAYQRPHEGPNG